MKLIEFLKNNEVHWELFLNTVGIKIERDGDLALFKYNLIDSNFTELQGIAKYCRGSIVNMKTKKYVAKTFNKFWNHGESKCDDIDWKTAEVQEKLDGSITKLWFYNKEWHISTNGTINAFTAKIRQNVEGISTFGDLFMRAWKDCNYMAFDKLDKKLTYVFELCTPLNRVVIEHKEYVLYFLSTFQNSTGEEIKIEHQFKTFKTFKFKTLQDVIDTAWGLSFKEEGYVVVDGQHHRCKIKSKEYLLAHSMSDNGNISTPKTLYNAIIEGDTEEIIAYFPMYKKQINLIKNRMDEIIENIFQVDDNLRVSNIDLTNIKEVSIFLRKESKAFNINMGLYKNKIDRKYVKNELFKKMTYKKFAKFFGKIDFSTLELANE